MSDKERLEQIQQNDLIQAISDGFLFGKDSLKTENIFRDVEWLIQQVERLEDENKRLREALAFYASGNHYSDRLYDNKIVLLDDGETARKALEGEE